MAATYSTQAQTPQWNWAKSVGSNNQDGINGGIHLDSAGNVYELILVSGNSIAIGGQTFSNPGSTQSPLPIFAKYGTDGQVLWAKKLPVDGYSYRFPTSIITDDKGYTYMFFMYNYTDTFKFGSLRAVDTTIHIYNPSLGTNTGLGMAKIDPNGNPILVKAMNIHRAAVTQVFPFGNNTFLYSIAANNDTIDGFMFSNASYLAIMDTSLHISRIKHVGYDSIAQGHQAIAALLAQSVIKVNRNKGICMNFASNGNTVWDSSIPISYEPSTNLIVKLDSLLNYQWHRTSTLNIGLVFGIGDDGNTYFAGTAKGNVTGDTVTIAGITTVIPLIIPYGQYQHQLVAKVDANGTGMWIDTFLCRPWYNSYLTDIIVDRMGNPYVCGNQNSGLLILDTISMQGSGDVFVMKLKNDGKVTWVRTTQDGQNRLDARPSITEDGHGNIYMNGVVYYNAHPVFGHDTLTVHTPVNGVPLAPDVFVARLGSCMPATPFITTSSALHWCGNDSVTLSTPATAANLWTDGSTTSTISVHQSGQYAVYSADTLGCYARSDFDTIIAHPQPVLQVIATQQVHCKGGNDGQVSLATSNDNGAIVYSFSPNTLDTLHAVAGTYTITATDSAGCAATATITITEPDSTLLLRIDTVGQPLLAIATGGTPTYSYLWNTTATHDTLTAMASGWYIVTATDHNGCQAVDSVYISLVDGVGNITKANVQIYPNPSTGNFYIKMPAEGVVKIYNQVAVLMTTQQLVQGANQIHTSQFSSGLYYVEITMDTGCFESKILVAK